MASRIELSKDEIENIRDLYENKKISMKKISEVTGYSYKIIRRTFLENNIDIRIRTHMHTIDEETKRKIINDHLNGDTVSEIEVRYSISKVRIRDVIRAGIGKVNANIKTQGKKHSGQFKRKYTRNSDVFEQIDTEQKAYFLGLMCSDGNIYKGYVTISLKDNDVDAIEKFKDFLETDREIKETSYDGSMREMRLYDRKMYNDLKFLGITENKSKTLDITNVAKHIPENLLNHFIRGYFDGDGTITKCERNGNSIFSVCATENSCIFIKNFLDIKTKILKDNRHETVYYVRVGNKEKIENIYSILYSNATVYMDRKFEKFKSLI